MLLFQSIVLNSAHNICQFMVTLGNWKQHGWDYFAYMKLFLRALEMHNWKAINHVLYFGVNVLSQNFWNLILNVVWVYSYESYRQQASIFLVPIENVSCNP